MVILACALVPSKTSKELSNKLAIELDNKGFFQTKKGYIGSVETSSNGIFTIGCAESPKDIQNSVIQAESAVGEIISLLG